MGYEIHEGTDGNRQFQAFCPTCKTAIKQRLVDLAIVGAVRATVVAGFRRSRNSAY